MVTESSAAAGEVIQTWKKGTWWRESFCSRTLEREVHYLVYGMELTWHDMTANQAETRVSTWLGLDFHTFYILALSTRTKNDACFFRDGYLLAFFPMSSNCWLCLYSHYWNLVCTITIFTNEWITIQRNECRQLDQFVWLYFLSPDLKNWKVRYTAITNWLQDLLRYLLNFINYNLNWKYNLEKIVTF